MIYLPSFSDHCTNAVAGSYHFCDPTILLQIEVIKAKYAKLEDEFIEQRCWAQNEVNMFLEDVVGVKWLALNRHRLTVESKLKRNHQVSGYS